MIAVRERDYLPGSCARILSNSSHRLRLVVVRKLSFIIPASVAAGLGKIGWHCFRHTYRSWMNAQGTSLGIQKDLMRHSSIAMTTQYGAGVVPAMREANSKVVRMVIQ
jgi:integrase